MKRVFLILLLALFAIVSSSAQTTRFWIGGGSSTFNDGSHWSLSSGGSAIGGIISWSSDDIARFDVNSGSPTVMHTSSETIDKLQISGSITVTFTPNPTASRTLTVGHTTASDNLTVASASTLIIKGLDAATDRNMTVTTNNITGITASIDGYIKVTDDATGYGEFRRQSPSTITFNAGSSYEHNSKETGSDITVATYAAASTCLITGITADMPGNLDQSFGNFTWNCASQTANFNLPTLGIVQGNFTLTNTGSGGIRLSETADVTLSIYGNYTQTGGSFWPSGGTANNVISLLGNFSLSGGFISSPGSGSCTINFWNSSPPGGAQTYSMTAGQYYQKVHFVVSNNAIIDMGNSIIDNTSSGNFTLNGGCGLKTTHSSGITSTGASGSIQLTGSRTYSSSANYTYYKTGDQNTGNGLQTSLTGTLTIGSTSNNTNLIFTNATTINGTLLLINNSSVASGNIAYGSGGTLEYQGNVSQTTGNNEWPAGQAQNVKINNSNGVTLNSHKQINSTLYLTSGALSISNYTLTLNGLLTKTGGSLTGGSNSNIYVGGSSGTAIDIPAITNDINNFTINRSASGIHLIGNLNILGTLDMIAGTVNLGSYSLTYGAAGTLKYTGAYTTSNSEFPGTWGPYNLYISNNVSLHADRTVDGTFTLNSGTFTIGAHTITLNGSLTKNSGTISGGGTSNIIVGGSGSALNLPAVTLNTLTLNRSNGINLTEDVAVNGNMIMTNGSLTLNGHLFTYGSGAKLTYNGSSAQTTADSEFPNSANLYELFIDNPTTVNLHADRTVPSTLTLNKGTLTIGAHTLTLNGLITVGSGTFTGGTSSNIVFGGTGSSTSLPAVDLNNLTINRVNGINLSGFVVINNNLTLTSGNFGIGGSILTLKGPGILGTPTNLQTTTASGLVFGGSSSVVSIPSSVTTLRTLTIQNPTGVMMTNNINVFLPAGNVIVEGFLNCGTYQFTGGGSLLTQNGSKLGIARDDGVSGTFQMTGGKTIKPATDFEFNSLGVNQTTNFLSLQTTIRNLKITNSAIVTYNNNLTLSGNLDIIYPSVFSFNPGTTMTVNGNTTLNGTDCLKLICLANNSPTASLINIGTITYNSASVRVMRFIPNWTSPTNGWHFLSSPVTNQSIEPNFTDLDPLNYDFYKWNEPTNLWLNQKEPGNGITNFVPGEGYLVAYNTLLQMKPFSGELNTSDIDFTDMTRTSGQPNAGWHLLGNPFPAALQWNDGNWNLSNVGGVCKVMDGNSGTYVDLSAGNNIPAMNGFMVYVSSGTNTLRIPKISRLHDVTTPWYKDDETLVDRLLLTVSSEENNTSQQSVIQFDPVSFSEFDLSCDSYFLPGIKEAPRMYSVIATHEQLSTNTLPYTEENKTVQLGFIKGTSTNYTLTASGIESFYQGVTILLEDKKLNITQDLRLNPSYSFSSPDGDNPGRFVFHFGGAIGIKENDKIDPFTISVSGNLIYVLYNDSGPVKGEVTVYNLIGQEILKKPVHDRLTRIDAGTFHGYSLVRIQSESKIFIKKVYIR